MPTDRIIKLNFDGCALGTPRQLGIGGLIRDHWNSIIRAYSKLVGDGFAIKAKVVALLEDHVEAKTLGLSNFVVQGDSIVVISWVAKMERGLWRLDGWLCQIFDIFTKLGWSIQWVLHSANQVVDELAKRGAKQLISFVGDYLPPWVYLMFVLNVVSLFVISLVCSVIWM